MDGEPGRRGKPSAAAGWGMTPDPVMVEVIRNAMIYAAEEMGIALRNASY